MHAQAKQLRADHQGGGVGIKAVSHRSVGLTAREEPAQPVLNVLVRGGEGVSNVGPFGDGPGHEDEIGPKLIVLGQGAQIDVDEGEDGSQTAGGLKIAGGQLDF